MARKNSSPPRVRVEGIAVPVEVIEKRIYFIRSQKVMLDADLAELYNVETRVLNQAVRRNQDRFPEDFMFQLSVEEAESLTSQFVTSKPRSRGGRRSLPLVFTEHGVAMLSSVLHSASAIQMNILIVRAFVRLRELAKGHKDLAIRIDRIEGVQKRQTSVIGVLADEIDKLKQLPAAPPKRRFGFVTDRS